MKATLSPLSKVFGNPWPRILVTFAENSASRFLSTSPLFAEFLRFGGGCRRSHRPTAPRTEAAAVSAPFLHLPFSHLIEAGELSSPVSRGVGGERWAKGLGKGLPCVASGLLRERLWWSLGGQVATRHSMPEPNAMQPIGPGCFSWNSLSLGCCSEQLVQGVRAII